MHKPTRRWYPCARTDLRFRSVSGGLVLCDAQGHRTSPLDLTAALVLTHCDGRTLSAAIADAVAGSVAPPRDRDAVRADVARILHSFASEGLLV